MEGSGRKPVAGRLIAVPVPTMPEGLGITRVWSHPEMEPQR